MDLDSLYKLAGIVAFFLGGWNFVVVLVAKTFWKLTFQRKEEEDKKTFEKIDEKINAIKDSVDSHESKNAIARHNFDVVTQSVYEKMDAMEKSISLKIQDGYNNIKEVFGEKIQNLKDKINEKK